MSKLGYFFAGVVAGATALTAAAFMVDDVATSWMLHPMTREIRRTPEVTAPLTMRKMPVKQVILQCRIVVWRVPLFPEHA